MLDYSFNELSLPKGGTLGLGCCPGHRLTPMAVVPRRGSLSADLKRIAAWKPHLVVTLMEEDELAYVGAPASLLQSELTALGVAWLHLPIPNLEPPDHRFETAWVDLWPRLDAGFRQGERLFLHCYAGLGRTGTVASLILMKYGLGPREAMRAVRAARPGSIETFSQEHYLSTLATRAP
ncbi:MAG TPA: phosphatase [Alphaproteobacteria bacterium]|nr:phosphatase [Alphaproteobacteria bacterium]